VLALSPVVHDLPAGSRQRHGELQHFLRACQRLQAQHTHQISFLSIMNAIGDRISLADGSLHEPLCELFTYFMERYAHPEELGTFDLRKWVYRHSAS
jgi:hypothetical protein